MIKDNIDILNDFLEANCPSGNEKHIVDLFKSTIYRQTMFAEFEYVHL